jgi:Ser/Thr protein kinase RdoA (MazF antagonist)
MAPVVRIGDTVRRVTGPWTPAVHALLQHLDGWAGAPRVLGIDDRGREIIEFVDGEVEWPAMHALLTDDGLARAGALLREYHDLVASFVPPPDAVWRFPDMARDVDDTMLAGEPRIICHNDCAPWNLVIGTDRWAFIDWDVAGPRPRLWDVGYAIRGMVLSENAPDDRLRRVDVFASGYGLDASERAALPEVVIARIRASLDAFGRRAAAGEEPWVTLWESGHRQAWQASLDAAVALFS